MFHRVLIGITASRFDQPVSLECKSDECWIPWRGNAMSGKRCGAGTRSRSIRWVVVTRGGSVIETLWRGNNIRDLWRGNLSYALVGNGGTGICPITKAVDGANF